MSKLKYILFILIIGSAISFAQKLNTTAELMHIANSSTLSYKISDFPDVSVMLNNQLPILSHGLYLSQTQSGDIILANYQSALRHNPEVFNLFLEAERNFAEKDIQKALDIYLQLIQINTGNSQLMTYIGHCYAMLGDNDLSKQWFENAIKTNYMDYAAHWFLSDIYYRTGDFERALNEITIAHILNRNDSKVMKSIAKYLNFGNYTFMDWKYNKPFNIHRDTTDSNTIWCKIDLTKHPAWMGYMICKALWTFEPGYREKMSEGASLPTVIIEEKECLIQLMVSYVNMLETSNTDSNANLVIEKDKNIENLLEAANSGFFNELIVYEFILTESPQYVFMLNKEFISRLADYFKKFRTKSSITAVY
jgi:tetratricopeptide (TPR) repeat protein